MHVALKLPRMIAALRSWSMRAELRTSRAQTRPELPEPDGLVAAGPAAPTMCRRGALALVGGGSLMVAVLTAGQTIGGITRSAVLLLPRGRSYGSGPTDFQVNRTAAAAGITAGDAGPAWRLTLLGGPRPGDADPGRPAGDAAAHRRPADRLRRRLVDDPDLDRRAAA